MSEEIKIFIVGKRDLNGQDLDLEMEAVGDLPALIEDESEITLGIKLFNRIDFNMYGMKEIRELQTCLNVMIARIEEVKNNWKGKRNVG